MLRSLLALTTALSLVAGHGRFLNPPSRASMWRSGFSTRINYDDDGLNCGGFARHYENNKGKCGVCGDPYDETEPRSHELGGIYGQGIIVAEYEAGQEFTATIMITAYHKGYWQLKICPDPKSNDQSCFDQYTVELVDGGTKYYPSGSRLYTVDYRLPEGLVCEHCVIQWKYVAGNNWGVCDNGTSGLGCGNQENFRACSDITIRAPNVRAELPIEVAASLDGIDQGLLDLLLNTIRKTPPKKYISKYTTNKRKNHRQPRYRRKPPKRKKIPFWRLL